MRKKIVIMSALLAATMANAEIAQSGFFVGADVSSMKSKLKYDNSGNMPYRRYSNDYTDLSASLKAGYQAYYTRVYARFNSFSYDDKLRNKYKISGETYEINADYIPVLYTSDSKEWNIRGILGAGAGYNSSTLSTSDTNLLPVGESAGSNQYYMEYGYQLGIMSETSFGVSVEVGYRVRYGNVQEFSDGSNSVTFPLETQEAYLGINYLF